MPTITGLAGGELTTAPGESDVFPIVNLAAAVGVRTKKIKWSTIKRHLISPYDPAYYEAVGDGVALDTTPIQDYLNSGLEHIYLPKLYKVGTLTVPSSVRTIYGGGELIQAATGAKILTGTAATNLKLDGIRFRGAWSNGQVTQPDSTNTGIEFIGGNNIRILNCYFTLIGYIPIHLQNCTDITVRGNKLYRCGPGIYLRGCTGGNIVGNFIREPITTSAVFTIGIALESTDGHAYGICSDIDIAGNHVSGYINAQGIMAHAGQFLTVRGNTVKDAVLGISFNPYNATDELGYSAIVGNVVRCPESVTGFTPSGNSGIVVQAGGSTPNIYNVQISGNTVVNGNRAQLYGNQGGIQIGYTSKVSVTGNTIMTSARHGIVLTDDEDNISIVGNVIADTIIDSNEQSGIFALENPKGVIEGNVFSGHDDSTYGAGIKLTKATALQIGLNQYGDSTTAILGGGYEQGKKSINVTSGTTVDLKGVDIVYFAHASPATVTTWSNVVGSKLYIFRFGNGNTTIDRTNSYLDGSSNINPGADDVLLMFGVAGADKLAQVGKLSANG